MQILQQLKEYLLKIVHQLKAAEQKTFVDEGDFINISLLYAI